MRYGYDYDYDGYGNDYGYENFYYADEVKTATQTVADATQQGVKTALAATENKQNAPPKPSQVVAVVDTIVKGGVDGVKAATDEVKDKINNGTMFGSFQRKFGEYKDENPYLFIGACAVGGVLFGAAGAKIIKRGIDAVTKSVENSVGLITSSTRDATSAISGAAGGIRRRRPAKGGRRRRRTIRYQ